MVPGVPRGSRLRAIAGVLVWQKVPVHTDSSYQSWWSNITSISKTCLYSGYFQPPVSLKPNCNLDNGGRWATCNSTQLLEERILHTVHTSPALHRSACTSNSRTFQLSFSSSCKNLNCNYTESDLPSVCDQPHTLLCSSSNIESRIQRTISQYFSYFSRTKTQHRNQRPNVDHLKLINIPLDWLSIWKTLKIITWLYKKNLKLSILDW